MRRRGVLLIIEADPQIGGAYELFLSAHGHTVRTESSVGAALVTAAKVRPRVVIVGNLPDNVDADTVAQRLRAVVAPHALAVIVQSSSLDEVPAADLVVPHGAHPRALLGAIRTSLVIYRGERISGRQSVRNVAYYGYRGG